MPTSKIPEVQARTGQCPVAANTDSHNSGDNSGDSDDNSASSLIEAPQSQGGKLKPHDFPDGGGSGGAEAFRRKSP